MCCDTMEPSRKGAWSWIGTGSWIGTVSWIDAGNKWLSIYLNKLFFIKATKAAGQSRLSKFEYVEYSKVGHPWPYQLTLPAVYRLILHG